MFKFNLYKYSALALAVFTANPAMSGDYFGFEPHSPSAHSTSQTVAKQQNTEITKTLTSLGGKFSSPDLLREQITSQSDTAIASALSNDPDEVERAKHNERIRDARNKAVGQEFSARIEQDPAFLKQLQEASKGLLRKPRQSDAYYFSDH